MCRKSESSTNLIKKKKTLDFFLFFSAINKSLNLCLSESDYGVKTKEVSDSSRIAICYIEFLISNKVILTEIDLIHPLPRRHRAVDTEVCFRARNSLARSVSIT